MLKGRFAVRYRVGQTVPFPCPRAGKPMAADEEGVDKASENHRDDRVHRVQYDEENVYVIVKITDAACHDGVYFLSLP